MIVAYGDNARREARGLLATLAAHTHRPGAVVSDVPVDGAIHVAAPDRDPGARLAKLNLDSLSPFDRTLYLDADTMVRGDISAGFSALAAGWDVAIVPSMRQGSDSLGHLPADDRAATLGELWPEDVLALQGGVMWFRKSDAVSQFFAVWRAEWQRFRGFDQGALLRALQAVPLKVWLLGRPWNGGALIEHRFGRARRAA